MLADTQQEQQAGHTKLTAVSIECRGKVHNFFLHLRHDEKGRAFIPQDVLIRLLDKVRPNISDRYNIR